MTLYLALIRIRIIQQAKNNIGVNALVIAKFQGIDKII